MEGSLSQTKKQRKHSNPGYGLIIADTIMADVESTIPSALDNTSTKIGIPYADRFNEAPENHDSIFRLSSIVCVEVFPVKMTSCGVNDLSPAFLVSETAPRGSLSRLNSKYGGSFVSIQKVEGLSISGIHTEVICSDACKSYPTFHDQTWCTFGH